MANDLNSVQLIGRLTKDSEARVTQNGSYVLSFSIAVNKRMKKGDTWEDDPNYFDIASYSKGAEALAQYLVKGRQVAIEGSLKQQRWNGEDGRARSRVMIIADSVQLLSQSGSSEQASEGYQQYSQGAQRNSRPQQRYSRPAQQTTPQRPQQQQIAGPESFNDDDVPF